MGIPYSREINAAFTQVTPLVAAGFSVLQTTKNISILLAVIQVLTVLFLAAILVVLVALCYCVNPDLEEERRLVITPILRSLAHATLYDILKGVISTLAITGIFVGMTYYLMVLDGERKEAEIEGGGDEEGKDGKKTKKGKEEGKGAAK